MLLSQKVGTSLKLKNKWSNIKVEAKKRIALHRQRVCAMGEENCLNEKLATITGESLLSGEVTEAEADTGTLFVYLSLK